MFYLKRTVGKDYKIVSLWSIVILMFFQCDKKNQRLRYQNLVLQAKKCV